MSPTTTARRHEKRLRLRIVRIISDNNSNNNCSNDIIQNVRFQHGHSYNRYCGDWLVIDYLAKSIVTTHSESFCVNGDLFLDGKNQVGAHILRRDSRSLAFSIVAILESDIWFLFSRPFIINILFYVHEQIESQSVLLKPLSIFLEVSREFISLR